MLLENKCERVSVVAYNAASASLHLSLCDPAAFYSEGVNIQFTLKIQKHFSES